MRDCARNVVWREQPTHSAKRSREPADLEEALGRRAGQACYDRRPISKIRPEEHDDDRHRRPIHPSPEDVKQLPERPGNLTLLRLYALYKQATTRRRPRRQAGLHRLAGKYKYEAWAALQGTSQDAAKQHYVELVESLKSGASA